ncbi:desmoglein-2.1-like [Dunckerocampus dactyliophorus]|uniref:desmoglein-2.1-like n=1 Tax=Dunckerocampus dactyliophorus TaxID=161453 RepID=UPI00240544D5|nr:desmoglein-2.1-like [Dunckerocampus dactyliophorus]
MDPRVYLVLIFMLVLGAPAKEPPKRTRREWIIPPTKLLENVDYTGREFIAKIRSDKDRYSNVEYFLSGAGADRPPYNIFVVDPKSGFVRVTGILDREQYPSFNLTGSARYADGTNAEVAIPLTVTVLDQNDQTPYFELHSGNVTEASKEGTFVMQIIGKDDDQAGTINSEIAYSIISQVPEGPAPMFTIDKKTGKLYVQNPILDRETNDFYKLVIEGADLGGAPGGFVGTGTVEIRVLDINDNIPTLEKAEYAGSVDENVADIVVMKIKSLDKDLEHTDNWLTVFNIATGNEDNLFSIETDKDTNEGILKLIKAVDFEEVQNLELGLLIENVAPFVEGGAVLMDVDLQVGEGDTSTAGPGAPVGPGVGAGSGVAVGVDVGVSAGTGAGVGAGVDADVDASVEAGGNVHPDAGVKGNGGPGLDVGIGVSAGGVPDVQTGPKPKAPTKTYPIKIAVNNMPEDPAFLPETKNVPVSENPEEAPEDGVLTVFAATDPDTGKPAEDVSYAKAYDPDNWFTVDEETAEIKLNKAPDRESPFVVNGTYIAKILAISKDKPPKTATGTLAIQVSDSNDHCPTLTTTHTSVCSDEKMVHVTAFDEDASPNAAPFTFRIIPDGTRGRWDVEVINETSATLYSHESLWPGPYAIHMEVMDARGLSCPENQIFTVEVCTCMDNKHCSVRAERLGHPSAELSASAIGLVLLALCLLLLVPLLLLFCQCGGTGTTFPDQFNDLPFDTKEHLILYHTEGKGEDKEVPLQSVPIMLGSQTLVKRKASDFDRRATSIYNESMYKRMVEVDKGMLLLGAGSGMFSRQSTRVAFDDLALPDAVLEEYYSQKAGYVVPVKDSQLVFHKEGPPSSAGSVGCCSLLESENDLNFLNDLGPKFKTLAEICSSPPPSPKLSWKVSESVTSEGAAPAVQVEQHVGSSTEKEMSSTDKSSVRSRSSEHSSGRSVSSAPRHEQMVVLKQQQPLYYTTSTMLQPINYVLQPQAQSTLLLADGVQGAGLQGLYVVNGPPSATSGLVVELQSPPSGLVVEGSKKNPSGLVVKGLQSSPTELVVSRPQGCSSSIVLQNNPKCSTIPTLLLSGHPDVGNVSVSVEGWRVKGPNGPGVSVKKKSGQGKLGGVEPGSPRSSVVVKKASPVKKVSCPAD